MRRVHRLRAVLGLFLLFALGALGMGPCATQDFDLGVGAFEIGEDRAILWTHAVPIDPNSKVAGFVLEVATDESFTNIVRTRPVAGKAIHDFTVRVLVDNLSPATRYHYRFIAEATAL